MKKILLTLAIPLISMVVYAQTSTCNGTRYLTEEFTNATSTTGVLFGNNTTYSGSNQDLYMDIYEPDGDLAGKRPVLILAAGGSFIGGTRTDIATLCEHYAKRGFVTVTIDYRLYDGPLFPVPTATQITEVAIMAMSDMKAAIRFLKKDAATTDSYRIDTNNVFVGGVSSGAIVANLTAYLDELDTDNSDVNTALAAHGGLEGNSNSDFTYSSTVHGVLSFSGAILDTNFIDANEPPLFMAHDDQDATIPYGSGSVALFSFSILPVEGSSNMATRAMNMGLEYGLITVPNSTAHTSYFEAGAMTWQDSVHTTSATFLNEIICQGVVLSSSESDDFDPISIYPNPSTDMINLDFTGTDVSSLRILSLDGRVILSDEQVSTSNYQLEIDEKPGVFLLELTIEGSKKSYRLIKD